MAPVTISAAWPYFLKNLGVKAKEGVREKFLTTRLLSDYLDLLADIFK